ncbi:MAG: cytochrome c oxidase subunit II [Gemmatimonadota bacterium]
MMTPLKIGVMPQLRAWYDRDPSVWDAASPHAHRLASLGAGLTIAGTVVFLVVLGILATALWRRRTASGDLSGPAPAANEHRWVIGGGLILPVLVLTGVFIATLVSLRGLGADDDGAPPPDIIVIGHQWWWEIRYPVAGVVTANELHLPVGSPVRVELQSADVIHSLWVPNLEGKTDLIPGQRNHMTLAADTAGVYRAQCAEFCGLQHAHMALTVIAEDSSVYARWVQHAKQPAPPPADPAATRGQAAFFAHSCAFCHTIRGTSAGGRAGPDLTHLGGRRTLAAGTLTNTTGNLAGWISNPDRLKPGSKMPPIAVDAASLQAIIHYLESLK